MLDGTRVRSVLCLLAGVLGIATALWFGVRRALPPEDGAAGVSTPVSPVHDAGVPGGSGEPAGEAAAKFRVLPNIVIALVLHEACEDFPNEANVLFDATCRKILPAEDLAVAASLLVSRVCKPARTAPPGRRCLTVKIPQNQAARIFCEKLGKTLQIPFGCRIENRLYLDTW